MPFIKAEIIHSHLNISVCFRSHGTAVLWFPVYSAVTLTTNIYLVLNHALLSPNKELKSQRVREAVISCHCCVSKASVRVTFQRKGETSLLTSSVCVAANASKSSWVIPLDGVPPTPGVHSACMQENRLSPQQHRWQKATYRDLVNIWAKAGRVATREQSAKKKQTRIENVSVFGSYTKPIAT